ncbi:Protein phosphatase PP2A regulatory subunit A [Spironucleus salmonicida]|uniref:Protein phosphatase PP2A regulatory subunit A n=1 Tax=Spironucleus salmonicida TaxID=348837 RepID=V6LRD4_9EUKA|nr:Protein phosphatase PP2A regulatory subunit A [Spironucleus salmonicida]|eukprot:EST47207.1 Protein phosphatase PP2A regulatory subunit A [Spironucleus salmonicida]
MTQIDPIFTFQQDVLYCFEHDIKVQACQNIVIVALAAGPEKSLELLKTLNTYYTNQPEEVLVALSCRVGDLLKVTNTQKPTQEGVIAFLAAVDGLSQSSSHHVNTALCYSFKKVLTYYKDSLQPLCQFVFTLSQSISTMQRYLAAQLIPLLYNTIDLQEQDKLSLKQTLGQVFGSLVQDQDALVRQQCAVSVSSLVNQILIAGLCDKFVHSPTYIFACFDRLAQDLADPVRAQNVDNGLLILKLIVMIKETIQDQQAREFREVKEILPQLIKAISRGSSDRYWRIRYRTAILMPMFFEQIHKKLDVQDCAVMFRLLTEDCEQDIRLVSLANADQVLQYLDGNTTINIFAPALVSRAVDTETVKVKLSLSKSLSKIAKQMIINKILPQEIKDQLKLALEDIASKLCIDKDQEVRAQAIDDLLDLYNFLPDFSLKQLKTLASQKDPKWRVRCAILRVETGIIKKDGKCEDIIEELISYLTDEAFEVRQYAIDMIAEAGVMKGVKYVNSSLIGQLFTMSKSNTSSFQNRISCCGCLVQLLKAFIRSESVEKLSDVAAQLITFCSDTSIYVRQEICKNIRKIYEFIVDNEMTLSDQMKNLLNEMFKIQIADSDEQIREDAAELLDMLEAF